MATRYIYNNQKYTSLYSLRQAIWQNERKAYGELKTQEEFDNLDLKVTLEEYNPEDELPDEAIAQRIRNERNSLISQTDFYVQPDDPSTPEGLEAVKAYRQALRDITEQKGFPRNVEWPEVPNVLRTGESTPRLAKVGI